MAFPLEADIETALGNLAAVANEDPLKLKARKLHRLVAEVAALCGELNPSYGPLAYTDNFSEGG